ncbi:MAG TPA: hypothetical protein VK137_14620, partial [Planctomycetaceae bacterium]|nr:hypothetical protein [Planctomycetaceae bacterium]
TSVTRRAVYRRSDLPANPDPSDLARYIATNTQGMAVPAASGATRAELKRAGETALRAWRG